MSRTTQSSDPQSLNSKSSDSKSSAEQTFRPQVRPLDMFPIGQGDLEEGSSEDQSPQTPAAEPQTSEVRYALRDPEGFAKTLILTPGAAAIITLMNGERTLFDIQQEMLRQYDYQISISHLEELASQLDEAFVLQTPHFQQKWQQQMANYLSSPVREAAHSGGAYEGEPDALRQQLDSLFTHTKGPGEISISKDILLQDKLAGVISPHIDLHRGGPSFAWAYKQLVEESNADLFIIFGTAHSPMQQPFCISRKHFATPLGQAKTSQEFIDLVVQSLGSDSSLERAGGKGNVSGGNISATSDLEPLRLFDDESAHRHEHSIEFQVLLLQHVLAGRRDFEIVPILVGSFGEFVNNACLPSEDPRIARFINTLRHVVQQSDRRICFISGSDLAHIGQRFGDTDLLDSQRLALQADDDLALLDKACIPSADEFFRHVAASGDKNRICGLSPTYTMLQVMQPKSGKLLRYDQAVEGDGSSCVSFAAAAFYR